MFVSTVAVYYQWVPFVLGLQAIMFYVPQLIWQACCYSRTGTDLEALVQAAVDGNHGPVADKPNKAKDIAERIEQLLFQVCLPVLQI